MKAIYKKPLTIDEQVDYLEKNKRVKFNIMKKPIAKEILYQYGYINVIAPYKKLFARKNTQGNIVRDSNGFHIYDYDVEFSSYHQNYLDERNKYVTIYSNIMNFEEMFNSILSYEVIQFYSIDTRLKFDTFITTLKNNAIDRNYNDITDFLIKTMNKYDDIYIFFDRLSLSQLIFVYHCIDLNLQNKIFYSIKSRNGTLGYGTLGSFEDVLKRISHIRNCIFHFNSLAILVEYYDVSKKSKRKPTDKSIYKKIIARLS